MLLYRFVVGLENVEDVTFAVLAGREPADARDGLLLLGLAGERVLAVAASMSSTAK